MKPARASRCARVSQFAVAVLLLAGLGACLQPVNSPHFGGGSMSSQLSQVSVGHIDGYLGHIVKSELDYLLTNGAPARNTRYSLTLKISQGKGSSLIDSSSGRPQIVTLQVSAAYEIRDTLAAKIRGSGTTVISTSYDRSSQRYATLRAQRDAEERLGKALAERMKIIVASVITQGKSITAAPAPAPALYTDPADDPPSREPGDEG